MTVGTPRNTSKNCRYFGSGCGMKLFACLYLWADVFIFVGGFACLTNIFVYVCSCGVVGACACVKRPTGRLRGDGVLPRGINS
jgi:hypothetical protein